LKSYLQMWKSPFAPQNVPSRSDLTNCLRNKRVTDCTQAELAREKVVVTITLIIICKR
jgi:hypothetical protein